jgi:hypothetical protein
MLQIMLFGLLVVAVYLVSHLIVTKAEAWVGLPLGQWRTLAFFVVFLGLLLAAMEIAPRLVPALRPEGGP